MADGVRRPKFLLSVLVINAAWPLLARVIWRLMPSGQVSADQADTLHAVSMGIRGLESVLNLIAVIAFMVFIFGVFKGLRAAGRQTSYSPGLAVGSWFIPFANFVMPARAVAEAYRLRTGKGTGIVVGWWLCYLLMTVLRMGFSALEQGQIPYDPTFAAVLPYLGYLTTGVTVGGFLLWAAIVSAIAKPHE